MAARILAVAMLTCLGACVVVAETRTTELLAQMEVTLDRFRACYGFPGATAR